MMRPGSGVHHGEEEREGEMDLVPYLPVTPTSVVQVLVFDQGRLMWEYERRRR